MAWLRCPLEVRKLLKTRGVRIEFNNINVNSIESSSGVFIGPNVQWGWSSHMKRMNGFGTVTGMLNRISHSVNVIYDNDLIDTPIDDRDIMIGKSGRTDKEFFTQSPSSE